MPPEFDPAWEYWMPDPEIAEILESAASGGWDIDFAVSGMRFGTGNPDHVKLHLAPERIKVRNEYNYGGRKRTPDIRCKTCQQWFHPIGRQIYCSVQCVQRFGPPRVLLDQTCPTCSVVFRPVGRRDKYCSLRCAYRSPIRNHRARTLPDKLCRACGNTFHPDRATRVYCKNPGCARIGNPATLTSLRNSHGT